jgi:hypothetical protein
LLTAAVQQLHSKPDFVFEKLQLGNADFGYFESREGRVAEDTLINVGDTLIT